MKTIKLFAIAAIALGMMACNKKENTIITPDEGAPATLSVKVEAGNQLRATGVPMDEDVKSLEVYVYAGDVLEAYKKVENSLEVTEISVTTGERTLVVVANANLGQIASLAALEGHIIKDKLVMVEPSGDDQTGVIMTAKPEPFIIKAGKNVYGYPSGDNVLNQEPLELVKVPARISLKSVKTEFSGVYEGWTFEPAEVFVFNVPGSSKLFDTPLSVGSDEKTFAGVDMAAWSGALLHNPWEKKEVLRDELTDLASLTPNSFIYFHTFENPEDYNVILTIKGKLKNKNGGYVTGAPHADTDGFTYYSILVNATKPGYSYTSNDGTGTGMLQRNTDYQLAVTIKRPGTDDPTTPPADAATLDVKVAVKAWVVVNQNVEY